MLFYFSATGNSFKAAELISQATGDELHFMSDDYQGDYRVQTDRLGLIYPVHCFDNPSYVMDFIDRLEIDESCYIYVIVTCGENAGNALVNLDRFFEGKNRKISYARSVIFPNTTPDLIGNPEDDRKIREAAYKKLELYAREINNGLVFREEIVYDDSLVERIRDAKSYAKKHWSLKELVKDDCESCERCVQVCPSNNIEMTEEGIRMGENCSDCMSCVSWCPSAAIRLKEYRLGDRERYRRPDIDFKDIILNR